MYAIFSFIKCCKKSICASSTFYLFAKVREVYRVAWLFDLVESKYCFRWVVVWVESSSSFKSLWNLRCRALVSNVWTKRTNGFFLDLTSGLNKIFNNELPLFSYILHTDLFVLYQEFTYSVHTTKPHWAHYQWDC